MAETNQTTGVIRLTLTVIDLWTVVAVNLPHGQQTDTFGL